MIENFFVVNYHFLVIYIYIFVGYIFERSSPEAKTKVGVQKYRTRLIY